MDSLNQQLQISNCPTCGELFLKNQNSKCKNCQRDLNKKIKILRSSIRKNPDVKVNDLQEMTNISKDSIVDILKESNIVDYNSLEIKCKLCGRPVKVSSRKLICDKCCSQLANTSQTVQRIERLKETVRTKSRNLTLASQNTQKKEAQNTNGFKTKTSKNSFKANLSDDRPVEVEFFPEISRSSNLKLSNKCKLVKEEPKRMVVQKKKASETEKISPTSLKTKVKEHIVKFINYQSPEIEILPDILSSSKLKLSQKCELAHLIVYN